MNEHTKIISEDGSEVLDPRKAMMEQTLAVDLARVEIDQQIATAHRFPRHVDTVVKKIATLACYNKEAAENCIYALPRGGKPIIGPSIGFASIVAQSWGNCRVRSAITYVDRKEKSVLAAGQFFDLETNTETIVPVTRRIVDSKGRLYSDDMINVTGMAAASIAARNAVLRGVTRGLWHPVYLDALGIVRGNATTFAENKSRAISAMAQFGVKAEQLWMYLGLKGELELTLEHIPTLRGMYSALRDGSMTVEEMFDPRRMTGKGFETVDNPLGDTGGENEHDGDPTAGMGEAPARPDLGKPAATAGSAPKQEPAQAGASGHVGAQNGGGAGVVAPTGQNAPAVVSVAPQPDLQPTPPAQAAGPSTPDGFLDYWEEYLASAQSTLEIAQRWAADRDVRRACRLQPEQLAQAKAMREHREQQLSA